MKIIERPVRNWSNRPAGMDIDAVVIHYTAALGSVSGPISWFDNPTSQASAHYVIDRNGDIYRCVSDDKKSWHAGVSVLDGIEHVNDYSIGIELHNSGYEPYPAIQISALVELTVDIMQRNRHIALNRVVGHSEVALPKGRKIDPGPYFDWDAYRSRVRAKLGELGL